MEVTSIACCSICYSPQAEWVEILDYAVLLCRACLDGVRPIAVVVYDSTVPVKMAIDLDSEHADWRIRIRDMNGFSDALDMLYVAIDALIAVKLALI